MEFLRQGSPNSKDKYFLVRENKHELTKNMGTLDPHLLRSGINYTTNVEETPPRNYGGLQKSYPESKMSIRQYKSIDVTTFSRQSSFKPRSGSLPGIYSTNDLSSR